MPEIPGLMLWKSGHAGVYIGGGYAIEAMGTSKGVVKTRSVTETGKAGESSPILTIGRENDGKNDSSACDTLEIWHFTN